MGVKRIQTIRTRGGNKKYRALRLDTGNFAWGSEAQTRKTRIIDVVYNASNNELVRTKTLVKNCIVSVDAAPFKLFLAKHYGLSLDAKKGAAKKVDSKDKKSKRSTVAKFDVNKASATLQRKWAHRNKTHKMEKSGSAHV